MWKRVEVWGWTQKWDIGLQGTGVVPRFREGDLRTRQKAAAGERFLGTWAHR